ncbi:hypothetical protein tb265_15590 [Gemmatimonadetes bacterium T265]|nr:hypothetical protein tb265_15590 [Gemmatimonadetes bacterium T265]
MSNGVELRTFTEFDDNLVSSLDDSHVSEWSRHRSIRARHRVTTQPLADILDAHNAPHDFELLTVDVEGHDLEVLRSLRMPQYRPYVIVVELHGFDLYSATHESVVALLADNGYRMVAFAKPNGFFLRTVAGT